MWTATLLSLLVLAVGTPVVVLLLLVDDWRRDLTTNVAATAPEAADSLLRPLELTPPVGEVAQLIEAAAAGLRGWQLLEQVSSPDGVELRFVRTTRWLRFKDDIVVRVHDRGLMREVTAVSASRVGRGDLGQNPRNLRELFSALRATRGLGAG
jgi:uncharacterized protein (DUF1499 family)